jgi:hypothetical protein
LAFYLLTLALADFDLIILPARKTAAAKPAPPSEEN